MLSLALALALSHPALAASTEPPAIPSAAPTWRYAAPSGEQKELGLADLVAAIRANGDATQYVWQTGWSAWKNWKDVPELKAAVDAANAAVTAPPAPAIADPVLSYSNGGEVMQLPASEVAKRVSADPTGNHLAWKPGMSAWMPAGEMPEVKAAMAAAADEKAKADAAMAAKTAEKTSTVGSEPTGGKPSGKAEKGDKAEKGAMADHEMEGMEGMEDGEDAGCCGKEGMMKVKVGGELRTAFTFANLGGLITENPDTGAKGEVNRARFATDVEVGKFASAEASINLSQTDDRSAEAAGLTGVSDGWSVTMNEAWVEVHGGDKVHLAAKVGAQKVAFGVNGYFEDYNNYFVDGRDAGLSLQQRFDVLPEDDLGVGVHLGVGEKLAVDVQYLNGPGTEQVEDNYGKNILGRAYVHPIDMLSVWVSGFYQVKELDNSVAALGVSAAGEFRYKDLVGVLGEFHYGGQGTTDGVGYNSMGYQVAASAYLHPTSKLISRISPVVTYQAYNPQLGSAYPYGGYGISAAGNVYWNAGCDCRTVMTGLAFQSYIPVNVEEPIVNTLMIQTAAKF